MILVLLAAGVLILALVSFLLLHPAFGASPDKRAKATFGSLPNYANGKFAYPVPTNMSLSAADVISLLKDSFAGSRNRRPPRPLEFPGIDWEKTSGEDGVIWFGHSALLLRVDNRTILVDPLLGPSPSPVSFAGSKRYGSDLLDLIDEMPPVDVVLLTHDHYDHLDYPSILRLRNKAGRFLVPLGVGGHLIRWGVDREKIDELNWHEKIDWHGISFIFTPSRHFSGRGMTNRNSTLWGGWVVAGQDTRLYISGDGGYGPHFEEIGAKYGPFDLTFMEGGQYDKRWPWSHMTPEEAVRAHLDVRGKTMMLMHWGAFTLAFHGWTEPIERALAEAGKKDVRLIAPPIGGHLPLRGIDSAPGSFWWRE